MSLALTTLFFAIMVAVPMGILAAWKHGSWFDRGIMALSVSVGFRSQAGNEDFHRRQRPAAASRSGVPRYVTDFGMNQCLPVI